MTGVLQIGDVAREIIEALRLGNVALVLGAGASVTSGAPTSGNLVDEMRDRFRTAEIPEGASFLDAGSEVCATPPYGRQQLIRFLRERMDGLQPSPEYRQLPRGHWQALFTTNYDDLIEKAYQLRVPEILATSFPEILAT